MDFANYGSASNLEDELAELMESALPGARSSLEVRYVRLLCYGRIKAQKSLPFLHH